MVEFALVLPMLALLVVGVVETGRFTAFSLRVSNAARAGAVFASIRPSVTAYDSSDIENAACADSGFTCSSTASSNTVTVTSNVYCTYSDGTADPSCALPAQGSGLQRKMFVHVATSASFTPLVHYPLLPSSVPMSAATDVEVDQGK